MQDDYYPVTSTLEEAATEIVRSSFAIFRVPPRTAFTIKDAWRQAAKILNDPPPPPSDDNAECWTRIVRGHLHGYNEPSRAKRLFRAFPASPVQPWPNEPFRQASQKVAAQLHGILVACHAHLRDKATVETDLKRWVPNEPSHRENESSSSQQEDELFSETAAATARASSRKRRRLDDGEQRIITSLPAHCPLDYFLYHNNDSTAINCSEHVDRGVLIAVCLTDVPGLEILQVKKKEEEDSGGNWFCPEVAIHNSNLYNEKSDSLVSDLICIMAGGDLSRTIERDSVRPCVHRVRKKLKRSRLSISYELRLLANV